jgi:hypothetical protein
VVADLPGSVVVQHRRAGGRPPGRGTPPAVPDEVRDLLPPLQRPVVPVASSCPWCGVAEPGGHELSSAVLGAWLLAAASASA